MLNLSDSKAGRIMKLAREAGERSKETEGSRRDVAPKTAEAGRLHQERKQGAEIAAGLDLRLREDSVWWRATRPLHNGRQDRQ